MNFNQSSSSLLELAVYWLPDNIIAPVPTVTSTACSDYSDCDLLRNSYRLPNINGVQRCCLYRSNCFEQTLRRWHRLSEIFLMRLDFRYLHFLCQSGSCVQTTTAMTLAPAETTTALASEGPFFIDKHCPAVSCFTKIHQKSDCKADFIGYNYSRSIQYSYTLTLWCEHSKGESVSNGFIEIWIP